jgi:hypothetical protein
MQPDRSAIPTSINSAKLADRCLLAPANQPNRPRVMPSAARAAITGRV